MFFGHPPNRDPELEVRHSQPQPFRARFEGTIIVLAGLIVLMVVLSVVFSII